MSVRIFLLIVSFVINGALHAELAKTHRVPHVENERVKSWKTTILPDQPLKMHRHDSPRVLIPLTSGVLKVIEESGATHELVLEEGRSIWLDKDPEGQLHCDENISGHPIEVVVVEFKS